MQQSFYSLQSIRCCWYKHILSCFPFFVLLREGPDRRIVYCLLCQKPYGHFPRHLKVACMKDNTEGERNAELKRAKESQREWTRVGRRWDYQELSSLVKNEDSCNALVSRLRIKGFFVINPPAQRRLVSYSLKKKQLLHKDFFIFPFCFSTSRVKNW